jgi:hypothetical protein
MPARPGRPIAGRNLQAWPRAARSSSKAASRPASGRTRKARTATRPRSSPTACSSSGAEAARAAAASAAAAADRAAEAAAEATAATRTWARRRAWETTTSRSDRGQVPGPACSGRSTDPATDGLQKKRPGFQQRRHLRDWTRAFSAELRLPHDPSWVAESLASECQRKGEAYGP